MHSISRKFIDSVELEDYEIETDSGWQPVTHIHKTIEYIEWVITTETGKTLICADDHIIFDEHLKEVFTKDLISNKSLIMTKDGPELVVSVEETEISSNMFDLTVDHEDHRFYSNDILSHNTTSATVIVLHFILFNASKRVALLANKADSAREILERIKLAFEHLPDWLQQGVEEWNKGNIKLENGSNIIAAATSSSSIRGKSVNLLVLDETAFINNYDEFFASVYPTISSGKTTKILQISTPNGLNHFYKTVEGARKKENGYHLVEVPWYKVPGRDEDWKKRTLADMNFDYDKFAVEYENEFAGSSGTLINGSTLKSLVHIEPIDKSSTIKKYDQPVKGRKYVIVADVSRGKGLDYSAAQIIDVTQMPYRQVCVYRSNIVTPNDYAAELFILSKMYNEATILVEINDIGGQVADCLYFDYECETLIYTENAGAKGKRIATGFGSKPDRGVRTTRTVKSIGCSILKLLLEQRQLIINDFDTIKELSTFSKKGTSYEAESGCHDDLITGLFLFAWMSDQPFFKELTDISTLSKLRDKTDQEIENEFLFLGFHDDGQEEYREEPQQVFNPEFF